MRDKSKFLDCLKTTPIIQTACLKTGISRATFYRWRKENLEFKNKSDIAMKKGIHFINDLAESQLISSIRDKNMTAIIFWLKHHHKNYSENRIYLSSNDQEKIVELFRNIDIDGFYQFILNKFTKGEISKSIASTLPSIINKAYPNGMEINKREKYDKAMDELEKIISACRSPNTEEDSIDSSSGFP